MQTAANTSVASHSPRDVETWSAWASRANNAYIGFLALTLVATVLIVVFNNRLNKAKDSAAIREKQASDERIATAGAVAAQAIERAGIANAEAGKANQRAGELESANLTLRGQVATLETAASDAKKDVAGLQKAAADAKAAQQRVETDLAKQQERAARAETELTKIRQPRILESRPFLAALKGAPKGRAVILYDPVSSDGYIFAAQIRRWLGTGSDGDGAGWDVPEPTPIPSDFPELPNSPSTMPLYLRAGGMPGMGLVLSANVLPNQEDITALAGSMPMVVLARALKAGGYFVGAYVTNPRLPEGTVFIIIGPKL